LTCWIAVGKPFNISGYHFLFAYKMEHHNPHEE
jgi:hypothetical protein